MRDENGFKCHTQSESHVRQMLLVGEDPKKYINDYSNQFQRDFLQQLKTSHGEKKININHFYQEYIANKEHVHMNATKWPSLTEFAKYLGREGICRVEDNEKGLHVAWIDNSPEALRRQDAIRKKERQDKGDEEREQRLIREQVERAQLDAAAKITEEPADDTKALQRESGEKIKLSFGAKKAETKSSSLRTGKKVEELTPDETQETEEINSPESQEVILGSEGTSPPSEQAPDKISFSTKKSKNVFAVLSKKNALSGKKLPPKEQLKKPISEAERIMKQELERKRLREGNAFDGLELKRQKIS